MDAMSVDLSRPDAQVAPDLLVYSRNPAVIEASLLEIVVECHPQISSAERNPYPQSLRRQHLRQIVVVACGNDGGRISIDD